MARSFASVDSAQTASPPISSAPSQLTMACWFKTPQTTSLQNLMRYVDSSNSGRRHHLRVNNRRVESATQNTGTTSFTATTVNYPDGVWAHASYSHISSLRSVYVNGSNKGSSTTVLGPTSLDYVLIGGTAFTTEIAFPCIWNVVLTDDEHAMLAAGYHPSLVRPEAIVALWEFDQGASPEPDHWGGYSLTLTGTTQADDPPIIYPSGWIDTVQAAGGGATSYTLTADHAPYEITSQAAGLRRSYRLNAEHAACDLTGQSASLRAARRVSADAGSLGLDAQAASLRAARKLSGDHASLSLAGQAANVLAARRLNAQQGSVTITGQDVALVGPGTSQRSIFRASNFRARNFSKN